MKTEQSRLRIEADEQIAKYRLLVADMENEKQELLAFLEEEKRQVAHRRMLAVFVFILVWGWEWNCSDRV